MTDRLKEEVNKLMTAFVNEIIKAADANNYDRDEIIKDTATIFLTMAQFATFENYIVNNSENQPVNVLTAEQAIETVHETISGFVSGAGTFTKHDLLLLSVNKAICDNLRELEKGGNK
jgi:hypothetical protein